MSERSGSPTTGLLRLTIIGLMFVAIVIVFATFTTSWLNGNYSTVVTTNSYHEFWFEYPIVLFGLVGGLVVFLGAARRFVRGEAVA
jgi:succinate dehydrogenase hydrophobic anchor subunit